MDKATLTVHFVTGLLGAHVSLETTPERLLETLRHYGRQGWTSGEVPLGGYMFPYDNERDFDWALIGARRFKSKEGDDCVWHRGHVYKRRELEAVKNPRKNLDLPAAVKYSRGAKATDRPETVEKSEGEFEYVTLAIFRGGRRDESLALPPGGGR